ncbi:hypothetical protein MAPG_02347, partial [Magnaporthiopsis poae ATCC 64411]
MGLLPLTYRRPQLVPKDDTRPGSRETIETETSVGEDVKAGSSIKSGQSGQSAGIPPALSFDKIMDGGTCPVTLHRPRLHELPHLHRAVGREPAVPP